MTKLLKGNEIARGLYDEFRARTGKYSSAGIKIRAEIIIAGDDPASGTYAGMITKNCAKAGIATGIFKCGQDITTDQMIRNIEHINDDKDIHGLIVMLPLWPHLDEKRILRAVSPLKDIDGVNPFNAGLNVMGDISFVPCTAQACADILSGYGISVSGKHVVIIGRSNIVGKPLANLLLRKGSDATVTVCHSKTRNIEQICRSADILITAIGSPHFVNENFINPDMTVVDVGMNEIKDSQGNSKLTGDVDFENVKNKVEAITPVPGGVSPLTHTALIGNILKAAEIKKK